MSTDRLWEVWNDEAKAALGAKEAGAVVDLWKVAGERVVFALCDFPDGDGLDRALGEPADRQRAGCRREDDELAGLPLRAVRRVPGRDRRGRGLSAQPGQTRRIPVLLVSL